MTGESCCALLLHGELDEGATPELNDLDFRRDVEDRLAMCRLRLARRAGYWSAVALDTDLGATDHCTWRIDADEAVVLLVFVALMSRGTTASVRREEVIAAICPRIWSRPRIERFVLPHLVNRRVLAQRGELLHPGPRFAPLDHPGARELAPDPVRLVTGAGDA